MDVFYVTEKCSLIRIAVQTYELKILGRFLKTVDRCSILRRGDRN